MNLVTGGLIEIEDYNDLAFEVNRLFSDNTSSLVWSASDLILNDTADPAGESIGAQRNLVPSPLSTDFIVVVINDVTQQLGADYTILYSDPVVITFNNQLPPSAIVQVFNRQDQRFGWGQQASVYPISAGDPVLADEATLQAYLEANVNNLIDKVNIMEARVDGPSQLTRVAPAALIYATDKTTIDTTMAADISAGDNYWKNEIATVLPEVSSFTRTTDWDNVLVGEMQHTWDTYDSFRYFFNSGNELRTYIAMTGDPSNQGFNNWSQVCDAMGTLSINYDTCFQSGRNGITSNIGAYELTAEYQTVFTSGSPEVPVDENGDFDAYGTYNNLVIIWEARIVEDVPVAGNVSLELRATLSDQELNVTTQGTITYRGGYVIASDVVDNSAVFEMAANAPTLSILTDFTDSDYEVPGDYIITNITQANPAVVTTSSSLGLRTGDKVGMSGVVGMTELNGNCYSVTVIDPVTFSLDVDSAGFTAYTSDGIATLKEWLAWDDQGPDRTNIASGFVHDVGGYYDVTVSTLIPIVNAETYVATETLYVAPGECFATNSGMRQTAGTGTGFHSLVYISFATSPSVNGNDNVQNVQFRVSDIELQATRDERCVIRAFQADGSAAPVTFSLGASLYESSGTVRSNVTALVEPDTATNSVLVTVAGPVQRIEIEFSENISPGDDAGGAIWTSDIYYEPQPA